MNGSGLSPGEIVDHQLVPRNGGDNFLLKPLLNGNVDVVTEEIEGLVNHAATQQAVTSSHGFVRLPNSFTTSLLQHYLLTHHLRHFAILYSA